MQLIVKQPPIGFDEPAGLMLTRAIAAASASTSDSASEGRWRSPRPRPARPARRAERGAAPARF
jgi:hypothetical protein